MTRKRLEGLKLTERSRAVNLKFLIQGIIISLLFLISRGGAAQGPGSVITYEDSIDYDEEDGKLFFPSTVFADVLRDELYIIDSKGRIIVYDSDRYPLYTLGKNETITAPQGVTVDAAGNLYIAQSATPDNPRPRISVFSSCLKWMKDLYPEGFEGADSFIPFRMAVDKQGNIYVVSVSSSEVMVLDGKGRLADTLSPAEGEKKAKMVNVTMDDKGRIFLVSEEEGRIYVYDENRKFLFKFGEKGGSSGKLSRPKAVAIDNQKGRMYVIDYMRHTITVYDAEGTYLFEFGGLGWGEGWFQHPTDIAIDKKGRIFVTDLFNQRVQVLHSW